MSDFDKVSKLEVFQVSEDKTSKEPALATGITTGSVAGILSIIGYLFPDVMSERTFVIVLIVGVFLSPIISAIIIRGKVWSPASVAELFKEATKAAEQAVIGIQKQKPSNAPKLLE